MKTLKLYQKISEEYSTDKQQARIMFNKLSSIDKNNFLIYVEVHNKYIDKSKVTYFKTMNSKFITNEKKRIAFNKELERKRNKLK